MKDKQIEEMADAMCGSHGDYCKRDGFPCEQGCRNGYLQAARRMYYADYRKQRESEWLLHKDGRGTCKACRRTQKAVWDDDRYQNYCGCCGAKMKGGEYIA